jgi:hypothetical protein
MSTKARSTKRNTKARSTKKSTKKSTKARSTKRNTKARSTKKSTKKSTKARNPDAKKRAHSSGILKGGTEVGIEKGDSTVGRINIGGEAGVESDYSSGEFKEGAEDVFDSIKSGLKAAKKKISDIYD